jgi:hypothetical protein
MHIILLFARVSRVEAKFHLIMRWISGVSGIWTIFPAYSNIMERDFLLEAKISDDAKESMQLCVWIHEHHHKWG